MSINREKILQCIQSEFDLAQQYNNIKNEIKEKDMTNEFECLIGNHQRSMEILTNLLEDDIHFE